MNEVAAGNGVDSIVIVAVDVDDNLTAARQFLEGGPTRFQICNHNGKSSMREYEVVAMPRSLLLGPEGQVVARYLGFKVLEQSEYQAAVEAARAKLPAGPRSPHVDVNERAMR